MRSDPVKGETNWKRVEELYHEALSKPRAERTQFLESACPDNTELRREVESLLASLEKDGALLEVPALEVAARMLAKSPNSSTQGPPQNLNHNLDLPGARGIGEASKTGAVLTVASKIIHHAPWWMYLLAAAFLADCILRTYGFFLGPVGFDFGLRYEEERPVIASVPSGSQADRAGIRSGDVLLALDGQPIRHASDWRWINSNLEADRDYIFDIEREGQRIEVVYSMERVNWRRGVMIIWQIDGIFLLATAFLIGFSRPYDFLARMGALSLAALSVSLAAFGTVPRGYAAMWRGLPQGVGALLWIPIVSSYLVGPILLTFFLLFPRPLFRPRWRWAIIWLPALCFVPAFFHSTFLIVYRPLQVYEVILLNEFRYVGYRLLGLYELASLAALAANYFRLKDPNDRRRLRVLFVGGGAGVLPGILRLLIWRYTPLSGMWSWLSSGVPDLLLALIFVLLPASFAYSILRHRLLDIRLIIRQGVQYAATRGALLSLVPVLGIILVADLLVHGDQPLLGILEARGWIYAALGTVAVGAHSQRRRWGEAIDRRFFREHYDARRLLRAVAAEASQARSFAHAAPGVVAQIEAALHPEFVAIMQRQSGETTFRTLSLIPLRQGAARHPCRYQPDLCHARSRRFPGGVAGRIRLASEAVA